MSKTFRAVRIEDDLFTVEDGHGDTYGNFGSLDEAWKEVRILRDSQGPGGRRLKSAVFHSSSVVDGAPGYRERSGQVVTIMRELGESERDEEVGAMFVVRFADGVRAHAFEDELEEVE
jgi:hypothetical protein